MSKVDWSYETFSEMIKKDGVIDDLATMHRAEIAYETEVFFVRSGAPRTRIFVMFRKSVFAYISNDNSVVLDLNQRETISHTLQRRINDLLRPRGWALICPDVKPPWKVVDLHTREEIKVDSTSVGKVFCDDQGYVPIKEVKRGGN